jgi:hypothetical protein
MSDADEIAARLDALLSSMTRIPGLAEEAARQAALLRETVGEKEAMDFIEAAFAQECTRQCRAENAWAQTPEGRAETAFWDALAAETWADLPDYDWVIYDQPNS